VAEQHLCRGAGLARHADRGHGITVVFAVVPAAVQVTVDGGTAFSRSQALAWAIGGNHTIATTAAQPGASGTQYVWLNWSDAHAILHDVTAPATAATYTANLKTRCLLTTAVAPSASEGSVSPESGYVDAGTIVPVSATANTDYVCMNHSGALTGTTTPQNLAVNAAPTVTANFAPGPRCNLDGAIIRTMDGTRPDLAVHPDGTIFAVIGGSVPGGPRGSTLARHMEAVLHCGPSKPNSSVLNGEGAAAAAGYLGARFNHNS